MFHGSMGIACPRVGLYGNAQNGICETAVSVTECNELH